MIWLTWRQFRVQALVGAAALLAIAVALVVLGTRIRHSPAATLAQYQGILYLLAALLLATPGLLGVFWGAPLVTRELETGTHRLVWNQSVTRRRWLAVKLVVVGVASMAVAGGFSLLLTWAASPYDTVAADRFTALLFGARNIAPVAYAAFAFTLGTVVGLMVRKTVPAMALTVLVFAVTQIVMPTMVRPTLRPPVTIAMPITAETIQTLSGPSAFLGSQGEIGGLRIPDAWIVANSPARTADGAGLDRSPLELDRYNDCIGQALHSSADAGQCLAQLDLHLDVSYQPGERYWTFQWLESAIFLALALLLAGLGLWRIQGRRA
jgi:ABC-type transport system involved in multi-copper enzyme maturation permease subunit